MAEESGPWNGDNPKHVVVQVDDEANGCSGDNAICRKLTNKWGSTLFEPNASPSVEPTDSGAGEGSVHRTSSPDHAPEKKLTLFALQLAVLEKAASGIGTLGFIWATVVLLGGFAITIDKVDFWTITIILLIEGARIFSRSHELEWQHQATWSLSAPARHSFRAIKSTLSSAFCRRAHQPKSRDLVDTIPPLPPARRTWRAWEGPLLPSLSRNVSRLLYWLQLLSAATCITLSLTRLASQDYGEVSKGDTDKRNRKSALNIFYALALAEALLFLLERAYWEWKVSFLKILDAVNDECGFGRHGKVSVRRFFYDAYSRCINGSIFDGFKMDFVSFAEELLESDSRDEQLIGARILDRFVANGRFADDTLRKIGTSAGAMERLVEMLNWKSPSEEEIRRAAAEIVSKLAGKKQNVLRVAGIPGSMESIASLLHTGHLVESTRPHEICHRRDVVVVTADHAGYDYSTFNRLGLLILKKLAHDHDNCGKIGNTRGLLPKIIDFTSASERLLQDPDAPESLIRAVKRSLQLLKMLAGTAGTTGATLRREISEIVFTVSNIRDILRHGGSHIVLQKLGIEILTSLAMEGEGRERIGGTGGVVRELFGIFFREGATTEEERAVRVEAGEALAMLALESEGNCYRMARVEGAVERLAAALEGEAEAVRVHAGRILHNLGAYGGREGFRWMRRVAVAAPTVLKTIMNEDRKPLEVSIGLARQIFKFMGTEEVTEAFKKAGIQEGDLAYRLIHALRRYNQPSVKVPRIRRFTIDLAMWMMNSNPKNIKTFKDGGLEKELNNVADTTSELELYNVFSGSAGLSRHETTMWSMVEATLEMLADAEN